MSKLKYIFIAFILTMVVSTVIGQSNSISIYDAETLDPLTFANVMLTEVSTGQRKGTVSDANGNVEIPFSSETRVEISYVGYQSFRKNIRPDRSKTIFLFPYESEIDEVVVTGNTAETLQKESIVAVRVIDKVDIEKRGAVNLRDVLVNEMNIQITQDGVTGSQIEMQGLSGENVKIMIDGVPIVGRLNGNIDLSQINLNNIERIEIIEGPLSVIYGTNAIAGVINLITKSNQQQTFTGSINGFYETTGVYNSNASIGIKKGRNFIQMNGGRNFFDGWNASENFDRNIEWDPKEQYFGDISYVYRSKKDWFHRVKAGYFKDRINNRYDPFINNPIPKAYDDWYVTERTEVAYFNNGKISKNWLFKSTNSFNFYKRTKNTYVKDLSTLEVDLFQNSDEQDTTRNMQFLSRSFVSYQNAEKKASVQVGYDVISELGRGKRFEGEDGGNTSITDAALFTSITYKPIEKISIQPAVRYGYNTLFKTIPTPSLALKFDINEKVTYRMSYGMGYRTPSLKELYLVFFDSNHKIAGNEDLIPERSHNINVKLNYDQPKEWGRIGLELKGFYNYKYDAIILTGAISDTFEYQNIGTLSTFGSQINALFSHKGLTINSGISQMAISNIEADGNSDLQRYFFYPEVRFNVSYNIAKWKTNISWLNKYKGASYDFDNNLEQVRIESFHLTDLTVSQRFWEERINLTLGVRNLLNVTNIAGSSVDGVHSAQGNTQIATGRSFFIGLTLSAKK